MLKLILLASCLALALSMPQLGINYQQEEKPNFGLTQEEFEQNPVAQSFAELKDWLPWLSVRTYGVKSNSKPVDTLTRASAGWFGAKIYGDYATNGEKNVRSYGVGGGLGELANIYYTKELGSDNNVLEWEAGI